MRSKLISFLSVLFLVSVASVATAGSKTIASGSWQKKASSASGSWKIVKEGGKRYIELSDDFKVSSAPDLKIFLSPLSSGEAASKTATRDSVFVARLPRSRGASRVEIPAGVDLADYRSVVIWCEQFNVLVSPATLEF